MARELLLGALAALFSPWPLVCGPRPLGATVFQCPDGTPPPCRGAARAPASLDMNRVAILPFRVSGADTVLGEGVAELIALEFTGTSGPRAAHMGSVLSAWHAAGGGARAPLPMARATRLAVSLGAGQLLEGSIVGLGPRVTVAASLMRVPEGSARPLGSVSGPVDSLEHLVRRLTVDLLAATGGEPRLSRGTSLTDSPAALRAYLEGLAARRRRRYEDAGRAFERALEADSAFASAAYARFQVGVYLFQNVALFERLAWRHQDRLPPAERVLLRAQVGESEGAQGLSERLRAFEEAVRVLPESPEALYHLGDILFHEGGAGGVADADVRAAELFRRSLVLDSQTTTLSHLIGSALRLRDTAQYRPLLTAYEGLLRTSDPRYGWMVAAATGDDEALARLRRRPTAFSYWMFIAAEYGLAAALVDTMFAQSVRVRPEDPRTWFQYARAAGIQGRPAAARRALDAMPMRDSTLSRDALLVLLAVASDGDAAAADSAAERLERHTGLDGYDGARADCARGLWLVSRGRTVQWDDARMRQHRLLNCALLVAALRGARDGRLTAAAFVETDSVVRERVASGQYGGFEHLVVARLWEQLGERQRALDAARRVHLGYPIASGLDGNGTGLTVAAAARLAGRMAQQLGDTAGAVQAYRRYLTLRRDAEPALVPQRDSVQAELDLLLGRRRAMP